MSVLACAVALALAFAHGCTGGASHGEAGTEADGGLPVGEVTYTADVRPILTARCTRCHQSGGVAPFALDSYEAARPASASIAAAARARIMPPWLADGSGACGTFRDSHWLSEREIAVLEAWRDQGSPQGDPSIPASPLPQPRELTGTISTLDIGVDYVPSSSQPDDYRCFVVDAPITSGNSFVTGYNVRPGNVPMVHHVIVYAPVTDDEASTLRSLDEAERGPGYTCFGGPGARATPVALWAPGVGAVHYPSGTGIQLRGGRPLAVQIHYNTRAGGGASDRTLVDLATVLEGVTPAYFVPLGDFDMRLAPRMSSISTSATASVRDLTRRNFPLRVFGAGPHMHTLGRSLRVEIQRAASGANECLIDVPRWDFDWQAGYFYEAPIAVDPDDLVTITCRYDTSSRTEEVTWGEGTSDEMCLNYLYVSL